MVTLSLLVQIPSHNIYFIDIGSLLTDFFRVGARPGNQLRIVRYQVGSNTPDLTDPLVSYSSPTTYTRSIRTGVMDLILGDNIRSSDIN